MGKIAFIFPGQGSQSVGMGQDLFNNYDSAKDIFYKADEIIQNISNICFNGPEEDLKLTINTQPAILTVSLAAYEVLKSNLNITPDYTAGHSLGEYAAMYAADVLDLASTIQIIEKRASLMNEAALSSSGSMAAVLGMAQEKIEEIINNSEIEGIVSIANYNSPDQIVITGEMEPVKKASELLSQNGAKRVIPLAVSGAFHSALMKDASIEFANFISAYKINNATRPIITNVDAKETINSNEFIEKMPRQIYSSVYWTQTIQYMIKCGVDTFIEIGPGKVLSGLNKKIDSNIKTYNVYDSASLNATIEALKTPQTI